MEAHPEIEYDEDFFEWEERDDSMTYFNHCIAGSIAGVTEHVLLLPFDTVKTHMQVNQNKHGALATARNLYNSEGVMKFWRGASVMASGCVPAHAMYFSVYEFFKRSLLPKLHDKNDQIYPVAYAMTGVFATLMHDLIITPFDTLKQRKQLAPTHFNSTKVLADYIIKTEGMKALYKGYPITVLMNVPQAAALVCVNESLKVMYRPREGHNFLSYLVCAATAGSFAAAVTIPFDNIKTRLQTQTFYQDSRTEQEKLKVSKMLKDNNKSMNLTGLVGARPFISNNLAKDPIDSVLQSLAKEIKYRDIISTAKTIFREEGVRGFVKGVFPRVCAYAPSSAVSWTAYEMMKKVLNKNRLY